MKKSILVVICIASFLLMLGALRTDSAIDDELAHIPAGYGYVHDLDYRLNPEHPPFAKALAMLPVLFLHPNFPTQSAAWLRDINSQWEMGKEFLYQSGNDADAIIQTGRFIPMLLTILLIILIYFVSREMMGGWWALLPVTLFAFDPAVLAHGHYVTTDMGAALGVVLATYFFLKFVNVPSGRHLLYAGLAFGVAQLTKFSAPLLVPLFIFLMFVLWLREVLLQWHETAGRFKVFARKLGKRIWHLIAIFAIGYVVVVYPVYFLFTAHYPIAKQVSDTQALVAPFGGAATAPGAHCKISRCLADLDIWMAKQPVLRPFAEYFLGILMVLTRASQGNTIYFLGEVRNTGGWTYFPILFLVKEPLPTLIIIFLALGLALAWMIKRSLARDSRIKKNILDYLGVNFTEFSMASFIVLYWGYSMHSPLNIGIRHLIPTIPFIYILSAGIWKKWVTRFNLPSMQGGMKAMIGSVAAVARSLFASAAKYVLLILLLAWLVLETLSVAPYFLSYFNELGGGVWNGYHIVTDSNYDWGQDLSRLQQWVNGQNKTCSLIETTAPCGIDKIAVDYFGGGNPQYSLGNREVDWWSARGNPADQGIHWFAISIDKLQNAIQPIAPDTVRKPEDSYSWLTALRPQAPGMGNVPKPDYRIGTSIFIYHL